MFLARLVIIRKTGEDGPSYDLLHSNRARVTHSIGSGVDVDIRINQPAVAPMHAELTVDAHTGSVSLAPLADSAVIAINDAPITSKHPVVLQHGDCIGIGSRVMRIDYCASGDLPTGTTGGNATPTKKKSHDSRPITILHTSPADNNAKARMGNKLPNSLTPTRAKRVTASKQTVSADTSGGNTGNPHTSTPTPNRRKSVSKNSTPKKSPQSNTPKRKKRRSSSQSPAGRGASATSGNELVCLESDDMDISNTPIKSSLSFEDADTDSEAVPDYINVTFIQPWDNGPLTSIVETKDETEPSTIPIVRRFLPTPVRKEVSVLAAAIVPKPMEVKPLPSPLRKEIRKRRRLTQHSENSHIIVNDADPCSDRESDNDSVCEDKPVAAELVVDDEITISPGTLHRLALEHRHRAYGTVIQQLKKKLEALGLKKMDAEESSESDESEDNAETDAESVMMTDSVTTTQEAEETVAVPVMAPFVFVEKKVETRVSLPALRAPATPSTEGKKRVSARQRKTAAPALTSAEFTITTQDSSSGDDSGSEKVSEALAMIHIPLIVPAQRQSLPVQSAACSTKKQQARRSAAPTAAYDEHSEAETAMQEEKLEQVSTSESVPVTMLPVFAENKIDSRVSLPATQKSSKKSTRHNRRATIALTVTAQPESQSTDPAKVSESISVDLQQAVDNEAESPLQSVQSELELVKEQLSEANTVIAAKNDELSANEMQIAELTEKLESSMTELSHWARSSDDERLRFTAKIQSLETELASQRSTTVSQQHANEALSQQLQQSEIETQSAIDRAHGLARQLEARDAQLEAANAAIVQLQSSHSHEITALTSHLQQSQTHIASLTAKTQHSEREITRLLSDLQSMKHAQSLAAETIDSLAAVVNALRENEHRLKSELVTKNTASVVTPVAAAPVLSETQMVTKVSVINETTVPATEPVKRGPRAKRTKTTENTESIIDQILIHSPIKQPKPAVVQSNDENVANGENLPVNVDAKQPRTRKALVNKEKDSTTESEVKPAARTRARTTKKQVEVPVEVIEPAAKRSRTRTVIEPVEVSEPVAEVAPVTTTRARRTRAAATVAAEAESVTESVGRVTRSRARAM